ncbi:MAG: formate--tetrahydrofolate ligase, partial [Caldibacillus sp.]
EELARKVIGLAEQKERFTFPYELDDPIATKIEKVVQKVYGGKGIELTGKAKKQIKQLEDLGFGNLPVCIAKTQYSFSDDPKKIGRPRDFIVTVRDIYVSAGAGFIVVLTGDILTMPGLPKRPAAEQIDITADGKIIGLF